VHARQRYELRLDWYSAVIEDAMHDVSARIFVPENMTPYDTTAKFGRRSRDHLRRSVQFIR